jgi:hypothetical protein
MLMPADLKTLAQRVKTVGKEVSKAGHVALLEWPTTNDRRQIRLSFLDSASAAFNQADGLYRQAQEADSKVGEGASWLTDDLSPARPAGRDHVLDLRFIIGRFINGGFGRSPRGRVPARLRP